jgi:hypothetical protein
MSALLMVLCLARGASAEGPATEVIAAPAPQPARGFVHASLGFNVYTHLGATSTAAATDFTPANRAMLFQQLGVGYWVHPLLRLQLTFMFGETLTGMSAGQSAFTLAAVMPIACFTWKGLFVGVGPLFAPRALGNWGVNVGLFTVAGYALSLGKGFSLALAVQAPFMFMQRYSAAVTPALVLGYRF